VLRYVTESSFDVFMWGTVERKAAFIAQVTRGDRELARHIDDVGEASLSYGEVKALATGNPLIMEKAGVDSEVAKLERLAHGHAAEQRRLAKTIATSGPNIERFERSIAKIERALELRTDVSGEAFRGTITGVTTDKRVEAGERIKDALLDARGRFGETIGIGTIAGLDLVIAVKDDFGETELHLLFPEAPVGATVIAGRDVERENPVGLLTRLTNRLGDLEERLRNDTQELGTTLANLDQAKEMIDKPFDQAVRLVNLRRRQAEITEELTPKPEVERTSDSTIPAAAESEVRIEGPVGTEHDAVQSPPSAFPNSIGLALVTKRETSTVSSSHHHDRSPSLSRGDFGR